MVYVIAEDLLIGIHKIRVFVSPNTIVTLTLDIQLYAVMIVVMIMMRMVLLNVVIRYVNIVINRIVNNRGVDVYLYALI